MFRWPPLRDFGPGHPQLLLKCFMRGDREDRAADLCEAQREPVFYVRKRLKGGKCDGFVDTMVDQSPVTNFSTKS